MTTDENNILFELRSKVDRIEIQMSAQQQMLASREWVTEEIKPIRESVVRQEVVITNLAGDMRGLFAAHDQLLKDRAEQEKRLYEEKLAALHAETAAAKENTMLNLIKEKWLPVLTCFTVATGAVAIIGEALRFFVQHYVLAAPK